MKNIVVNFESKTIELTKNFSKRAEVVGSLEYCELVAVMQNFPNYSLRVQHAPIRHYSPSPYSKLTYADMEEYINRNVDESQREQRLLELRYQKEMLGFAHAKAIFLKEFMPQMEAENDGTVA